MFLIGDSVKVVTIVRPICEPGVLWELAVEVFLSPVVEVKLLLNYW